MPHDSCEVRIIEVPPALHARFRHSEKLGLYQMIAKNAGIRRARGEYVLATNIDILFSEELMCFLAERRLERGKLYRIDRYDAMPDVPVDGSIEERLAYCASHLIRVNTSDGTFRVSPNGVRALLPNDIAAADSGISFQEGWYEPEVYAGQSFRWVNDDALVQIQSTGELVVELEPGPGTGMGPFGLEIQNDGRSSRVEVQRRSILRIPLEVSPSRVVLRVKGGGKKIPSDLRTLNFRVFWCKIENRSGLSSPVIQPSKSTRSWVGRGVRYARDVVGQFGSKPAPELDPEVDDPQLHTNACGDFTLLAKDHWSDLRSYPEFEMFSMNIDSLFCIAAHHGDLREEILRDPMRIYHIEHGSGWTPEADKKMYANLVAKGLPWVDNQDVLRWGRDMQRLHSPFIFNHENWGLAGEELKEISPVAQLRQGSYS
jgi:hypothetical protein